MCDFFSLVTNPNTRPAERFYFDWAQRVERDHEDCDSHSTICKFYALNEDMCNKYEYNPLTGVLVVDQINSEVDDRVQVHDWLDKLDWQRIVKPLIIKPIVNPFEIEAGDVTDEAIEKLHEWASVWAYISSFLSIEYKYDFSSCVWLWEHGFVPSFDGKTWRLHSGENASIVYELKG